MSDKSDSSLVRTVGQVNSTDKCQISEQDRCYKAWADIGELILAVISGDLFCSLAKRLALLGKAAFIPDSGSGNTSAAAFFMNLTEAGMLRFAKRRKLPVKMPGDERIYRFSDITGDFTAASEIEAPLKLKPTRRKK